MFKIMILSVLSIGVCPLFASAENPAPQAAPAQQVAPMMSNDSRVINISNPSFRKLIVALPDFDGDLQDTELVALKKQAKEDLPFLLQFTGFFKVIGQDAFAGKGDQQNLDELAFWKMISVDTVVQGKFSKSGKIPMLEISGLDVYRGRRLDKKRYEVRNGEQLYNALKSFVDSLLESYTGQPGIFQSKIVFTGKKTPKSQTAIFMCDPDGHNVEQLSKGNDIHISPAWDPTGKKVIYTSYQSGNPNLYIQDLRTRKTNVVPGLAFANKGLMNSGGYYSPQGKIIAYSQIRQAKGDRTGGSEIYVVPPEGGARRPLIAGNGIDVDPIFSPDGKWLVYASGRYGNPHLFRAELAWNADFTDVKVKNELRLTYAGWWNTMPTWSPNSQKIAFAGFDKGINRFDIFIMNIDGSKLERLTLQSGDNKGPTYSPNGHLILFHSSRVGTANDRGRNQLYIMNADGTEQRVIPTGLFSAEDAKWGPYLKEME